MNVATFIRDEDDECAACGSRSVELHASGEAMAVLLCEACMETARAEHERRCSFCGFSAGFPHRHRHIAWQDVAGRQVCDGDCAEKEAARQAAQPVELLHSEVDGLWGLSLEQHHVGPCVDVEDLKDAIAMEEMS